MCACVRARERFFSFSQMMLLVVLRIVVVLPALLLLLPPLLLLEVVLLVPVLTVLYIVSNISYNKININDRV